MSDKSEKAIDALHAELTDDQRATGNLLRKSTEADGGGDTPPMPDDLLNDVLSDLGVEKSPVAEATVEKSGLFDRLFQVLRGNSFAVAGLAAAACIVAIFVVNSVNSDDRTGVRGSGGTIVEPPMVVFVDPTPEQKAAAEENFEAEHLRFPGGTEPVANDHARILIEGGMVRAFRSGEDVPFLEVDAPADPLDLIDTISVVTQAFAIEE